MAAASVVSDEFDLSNVSIVRGLGSSGGFGILFLARDKVTGKEYAVKAIDKTKLSDEALESISNETNIAISLRHPHVVRTYARQENPKYILIYMDLYHGDVFDYFDPIGKLNECNAFIIFRQLASAIRYMHVEKHIAHLDIKLENLLFDNPDDFNVVLTDFGFSKHRDPDGPLLTKHSGSPAYAAPELLLGLPYQGFPADIWAMGVTLFLLVTGNYPFIDADRGKMFRMITTGTPDFSLIRNPTLIHLIESMLNKKESARPSIEDIFDHPWMKAWQLQLDDGYECGPNDSEKAAITPVSSASSLLLSGYKLYDVGLNDDTEGIHEDIDGGIGDNDEDGKEEEPYQPPTKNLFTNDTSVVIDYGSNYWGPY